MCRNWYNNELKLREAGGSRSVPACALRSMRPVWCWARFSASKNLFCHIPPPPGVQTSTTTVQCCPCPGRALLEPCYSSPCSPPPLLRLANMQYFYKSITIDMQLCNPNANHACTMHPPVDIGTFDMLLSMNTPALSQPASPNTHPPGRRGRHPCSYLRPGAKVAVHISIGGQIKRSILDSPGGIGSSPSHLPRAVVVTLNWTPDCS